MYALIEWRQLFAWLHCKPMSCSSSVKCTRHCLVTVVAAAVFLAFWRPSEAACSALCWALVKQQLGLDKEKQAWSAARSSDSAGPPQAPGT